MKKSLSVILTAAILALSLSALSCGQTGEKPLGTATPDTTEAVTAETETAAADTTAAPEALPVYDSPAENPEDFEVKTDENGAPMMIALTFDDAPNSTTCLDVVNMLADYNAKATFFVIGDWMWGQEEAMKTLAASGNEIGSHSYTHPKLTELSKDEIALEFTRAQKNIASVCGVTPTLFRPPYGGFNDDVLDVVDLPMIYGIYGNEGGESVTDAELFAEYCSFVENCGNGVILGFHCLPGFDRSLRVARAIIEKYRREGYIFVTVSEMFEKAGITPTAHTAPYYSVYKTTED